MADNKAATDSRSRPYWGAALAVGLLIQVPLLFFLFIAGLYWAGWDHWLALGQAALGLILVLVLARKYPLAAVAIPVVSFLVAFALWSGR